MKKFSVFVIVFAIFFGIFSQNVLAEEGEFESVSYTAPITLTWLSKSGVPEAVEFIGNLKADAIIKPKEMKDYERVEKANSVYQEIRYASLNDFIATEGYTTIIDLGCGVSPRGIYMARNGIDYIGVELETVVQTLEQYTPIFLTDEEEKHIKFVAADVTDKNAMLKAAENISGKVCIVVENLTIYLSIEQQKAMLENIREILKIHGGCFITSDHLSDEIFFGVTNAIYSKKTSEEIFEQTVKLYENTSEVDFFDTYFDTPKEAMDFIKMQGFKVEKRPLFTKSHDLYSVKNLNDRQIKQIRKFMDKKLLWVMTVQ